MLMHEFEDFVELSQKASSVEAVRAQFQNEMIREGYSNLVFVQMMSNGHINVPWRHLPEGYDDAYVKKKWHQIDPVLQVTMSARLPFSWSELPNRHKLKKVQLRFLEECRDLGVHSGYTVPIHSPGRRDIISLSVRDESQIDPGRMPLIHAKAMQAWLRYSELSQTEAQPSAVAMLSARERQCLQWIKAGKTYDDIGDILKMSPKTVEHHLRSTRLKLGVTTTLTAVVKAIQLGLIDL
jgi:DNA-binding CsgD family transcriptional regulator